MPATSVFVCRVILDISLVNGAGMPPDDRLTLSSGSAEDITNKVRESEFCNNPIVG